MARTKANRCRHVCFAVLAEVGVGARSKVQLPYGLARGNSPRTRRTNLLILPMFDLCVSLMCFVSFVLRTFCEGMKVACEMAVMAADAGLVPVGEEIVAIAGTGRGANPAALIYRSGTEEESSTAVGSRSRAHRLASRAQRKCVLASALGRRLPLLPPEKRVPACVPNSPTLLPSRTFSSTRQLVREAAEACLRLAGIARSHEYSVPQPDPGKSPRLRHKTEQSRVVSPI